jgi:HAD superfamily hydrolase (TIGR01458 family)
MIRAVLIDLSGTLHIAHRALPGAVEAVRRLRQAGLQVRCISNTSSRSRRQLLDLLTGLGLPLSPVDLFTAPLAVVRHLVEHRLRPYLLVHPDLEEEFAGFDTRAPNAVVVGFAGDHFTYSRLNRAFQLLLQGVPLLATGRARYFQGEHGLQLDAGPFLAALEYAAGTRSLVLGKPAPEFFRSALAEMNCPPEAAIMIGDDVENDVNGALATGLQALLVRSGKYRPGDENRITRPGASVVADLAAAADLLLSGR